MIQHRFDFALRWLTIALIIVATYSLGYYRGAAAYNAIWCEGFRRAGIDTSSSSICLKR